jgi:hypothetical protein
LAFHLPNDSAGLLHPGIGGARRAPWLSPDRSPYPEFQNYENIRPLTLAAMEN